LWCGIIIDANMMSAWSCGPAAGVPKPAAGVLAAALELAGVFVHAGHAGMVVVRAAGNRDSGEDGGRNGQLGGSHAFSGWWTSKPGLLG